MIFRNEPNLAKRWSRMSIARWAAALAPLLAASCALLPNQEAERRRDWTQLVQAAVAAAAEPTDLNHLETLRADLQALRREGEAAGYGDDARILFTLAWTHNELALLAGEESSQSGDNTRDAHLRQAKELYERTIEVLPEVALERKHQAGINLALVKYTLDGSVEGALEDLNTLIGRYLDHEAPLTPSTYLAVVTKGDLLAIDGDGLGALEAYEYANELERKRPTSTRRRLAAGRIVGLFQGSGGDFTQVRLLEAAKALDGAGFGDAALLSYEQVICSPDPERAEEALCAWVELTARQSDLSSFGVRALEQRRSESQASFAAVESAEAAGSDVGDLLSELMDLIEHTLDCDEGKRLRAIDFPREWELFRGAFPSDSKWLDSREPRRLHAFLSAVRSIAREQVIYGRVEEAALLLEVALGFDHEYSRCRTVDELGYLIDANRRIKHVPPLSWEAPGPSHYKDGRELAGLEDVGLEMTLDLVLLLHAYPGRLEEQHSLAKDAKDETTLGERMQHVLSQDSILARFRQGGSRTTQRTDEEVQRAHTVLALAYSRWTSIGWRGPAEFHFRRAIEKAEAIREEGPRVPPTGGDAVLHPVPYDLYRYIGNGLSSGQSMAAYNDAVDGYIPDAKVEGSSRTDMVAARGVYRDALAALHAHERELLRLEERVFPRNRLYVGGSFGTTSVNSSGADLEDRLRGADSTLNISASLDRSANGRKFFVGKRFSRHFEAELAYVDLGGPTSTIREFGPPNPGLEDAIRSQHPRAGRGFALSGVWTPLRWHRTTLGARFGGWYWDSDISVEVETAGAPLRFDDSADGFDLLYGVKLEYQFPGRISARAEYEIYGVDSDEVGMLSVGISAIL